MAVLLDALAPYVKNIITDMAKEKANMMLGVSGEINKLKLTLTHLEDYLADAEKKSITNASVQSWVKQLKDAMYKAADILELCQLEAMERQEKSSSSCGGDAASCFCSVEGIVREKLQSFLEQFLFCLQNPVFALNMGSRIKKLNQELDSIREDAGKYDFVNIGSYVTEEQRRPTCTEPTSRRPTTTSGFIESDIVGDKIQKDTEELVKKLISNNGRDGSAIKVVSIVGPGGMGKSTLAKKVFASEAVKAEFKTRIWLSVTQQFNKVKLFRAAITQYKREEAKGDDESFLEQTLTEALSANKFLLVLDDVWSNRAWEHVLQTPVVNAHRLQPGSRVLVTTRNEMVLLEMGSCHSSKDDQLRVARLNDDDAWSLLKKQLRPPQVSD